VAAREVMEVEAEAVKENLTAAAGEDWEGNRL